MESLYSDFNKSLALGKHNEDVIAHEFSYNGIPVTRTEGKNSFDLYLPDGRSVEIKLDVRSQCTGSGCIEQPSLQRHADLYVHTFTYARVFTHQQYEHFYTHGRAPAGLIGNLGYEARLYRNLGREGVPIWQFIRDLKASQPDSSCLDELVNAAIH